MNADNDKQTPRVVFRKASTFREVRETTVLLRPLVGGVALDFANACPLQSVDEPCLGVEIKYGIVLDLEAVKSLARRLTEYALKAESSTGSGVIH